jgi:hypothetical protein
MAKNCKQTPYKFLASDMSLFFHYDGVIAMRDEFNALVANKTWCLSPRPGEANIISDKWVSKHKFNSNNTPSSTTTSMRLCTARNLQAWSTLHLKQAPQAWYNHFMTYARALGFSDTFLFVLLYVDDIAITTFSNVVLPPPLH